MVNVSWINDQVIVSGAIAEEDMARLRSQGIDAIVDLRSEYRDDEKLIKELGMQFLHVMIDDGCCPTFEQLDRILDFSNSILDEGKRILIHCQNGCGRSPFVIAALLAARGMKIPDAVGLIKDRHPNMGFTDEQERFIDIEMKEFLKSRKQQA